MGKLPLFLLPSGLLGKKLSFFSLFTDTCFFSGAALLLPFHKEGPKGPHEGNKKGTQTPAPSMKKAAIQSYRINKGKRVRTRVH